MVTCNEQDIAENKTYIEHPKLVIEVLSPSTEKTELCFLRLIRSASSPPNPCGRDKSGPYMTGNELPFFYAAHA